MSFILMVANEYFWCRFLFKYTLIIIISTVSILALFYAHFENLKS